MTPLPSRHLPVLLAGAALVSTALVITGAGTAAAVPVGGEVTSSSSAGASATCTLVGAPATQTSSFSNGTGGRTAQVDAPYAASQSGTVGASGRVNIETTASGSAANRAFRRVDLESTGVVVAKNDSDVECGMELVALSQSDVALKVRERGRVRISWTFSVGDLEQIDVTNAAGTVLHKEPTMPEGVVSVRVRPGTYHLATTFSVSAQESGAAPGASTTRIGFYTLKATFARPS